MLIKLQQITHPSHDLVELKHYNTYFGITPRMSNLRVQITFNPQHMLTTVGSSIHVLPNPSYLRILNSVQLIKVNTSSSDLLKIGQSFYMYFHFSGQYLCYDPLRKLLRLGAGHGERTQFKILTDRFDWNSRGLIDMGMIFKYRIILAEHNSRILTNQNGQLVTSFKEVDNSLVSFTKSIYSLDSPSYPIKLSSLENSLVLCYKNNKTCTQKMPSICQYMMSIQAKQNTQISALKHLDSNSYLVKSGKQFVFMKDAPSQLKYCFHIGRYDAKGKFMYFQALDTHRFVSLDERTGKCQASDDLLSNVIVKEDCSQQAIKNILVSAWLKAELPLPSDQDNIMFILEECQKSFQQFSQTYQTTIVQGLIAEGIFLDLDFINGKYSWQLVGPNIIRIVKLMLKIKKSWITDLFSSPNMYQKLMQQPEITSIVQNTLINVQQVNNPHQILRDVHNLILREQNISLTVLKTVLMASPLIHAFAAVKEHKPVKEFVDFACNQIVPQLKKQALSSFFSIGLKIVKANTTTTFFNNEVMTKLSLKLLQSQGLTLQDKLILIQKFQQETGPYVYIVTENQAIRSIAHQAKNSKTVAAFIQDILPKNCRFETYENKLISICLIPFHLKVNHILELNDCKQYMKYLLDSITSYNYEQNPQMFLKYSLKSSFDIINRLLILICEKSLQYDSITNQESLRVGKCKRQIEGFINQQTLNLPVVWNLFKANIQLTQDQQDIFVLIVKICQRIIYPQKFISRNMQIMKTIDDPSPYLIKSVSLFLQREHSFNPILASEKLTSLCKEMQEQEYKILTILMHENDMYQKLCHKSEAFYKVINTFATANIMESNILNAEKILNIITKRRGSWMHTDHEYNFLRNLLIMIGGVVSMEIYECYEKYICAVRPDKWSLHYFRLCRTCFMMSPVVLKKRFVVDYHDELKSANQGSQLQKLFVEKGSQFVISYVKLLLAFADFHSSKELIYGIMGDETLYNLLAAAQMKDNIELRVKILEFMIKARKRFNEYEAISASASNLRWLKKGTLLIREKLGGGSHQLLEIEDHAYLKDYTCALLDFLQMREEITLHTQISEDEALDVEGTNKIFAFKLAQLIDQTVKSQKIERNLLDKIQWFENQYKIGIDTMELTKIAVDLQKQQIKNQNFQYNYMLIIKPQIQPTVNAILTKIDLSTFVTCLIRVVLSISIQNDPNWQNLELLLNYFHYIVSNKVYSYSKKDLDLLFLAMMQLIKNKKVNMVALIQNSIRKIIITRNGILEINNQMIVQENFLKNKVEMFEFLAECISNYTTFSPVFESALNYFNQNGQASICWKVSCYISMLRFLISLCKSLSLKFKQIFSESQVFKKQFIGRLIQVNQRHITELLKDTSDAKLTIIAYEIELINNLMLGPVETNIQMALKFRYEDLISLITLPDLRDEPGRINTFKIIVHIKKLVSQTILIIAPFHKFTKKQLRIIEDGFIAYYRCTKNLTNDDLDSIIIKYSKENKNDLQVMNFDLSLSLFFSLIRIYEKQENFIIKKLRTDTLQKVRLVKTYNKKFKMFYQMYRILKDLISWIIRNAYRCCRKTNQAINLFSDSQKSHQDDLKESFHFFVKHVSSVEIQVRDEMQTVYFLLLRETRCYNNSIRKQLHRNVGLGDRDYRMAKFMLQTNHVVLRLEIEKNIKKFTQKYRPIEIIIKNRQLWKSLNFLCACLMNLLFLDEDNIANQTAAMFILRGLSYIFCIFLYTIYFVQNLPLKRRLSKQMAKSDKPQKFKKLKSCLEIFNDKTLWFATIYFVVISLSIYQEGFVAVLMIDFFVRFKISKKVTQIITRPILQLFLIVLVSVQIAFIFTFYMFFIHSSGSCSNTASCVQSTYFQYLGLNKNDVVEDNFKNLQFRNIIQFFATFFTIMINNSLIIGVLLYEKKAKDSKIKDWQFKVKQRCFICDTERNIVDRARNDNKGFFEHIQEEHNLWNYIYYLIYLKNKQLETLNVVESFVMGQWRENKIDWLPKTFKV